VLFVLFTAGLAAGVYFVMTAQSTAKAISGAALSVLGAFGISAASLKATVADVGKDLATHVWGAELNLAIAEAITIKPGRWNVKWKKVIIPPRGEDPHVAHNADRLTQLLEAVVARTRARTRIVDYLHSECRLLEDNSQTANTKEGVAAWLLTQAQMLREPEDPVPGIAGRLLSTHRNGNPNGTFFVWTFADGKLSELDVHTSYRDALEAAGLLHAD
jgi:hypothetical protein